MAKKKPSVPESCRISKVFSLRLHPTVATQLMAISRATGVSRNRVVSQLIMAAQPQLLQKLKKPRARLLRPPQFSQDQGGVGEARCAGLEPSMGVPFVDVSHGVADGIAPAVVPAPFEARVFGDPDPWVVGSSGEPWESREQGFQGEAKPPEKRLRRLAWAMSEALFTHGGSDTRVGQCCRIRHQAAVDVVVREGETGPSASFRGVATCGSVWGCPICMRKIKSARAEEIKQLVAHHGQERVVMMTLTIRHSACDDLRTLLDGITRSIKELQQGNPWLKIQKKFGIFGLVRAFEITHGQHGWHPHHHVLIFLNRPLSGEEMKALRDAMSSRWHQEVVESGLGEPHAPDDVHGCVITSVRDSKYLSKLGLEMADIFTKKGRDEGSRTPMQLAYDILRYEGREEDIRLWKSYTSAIKGKKFLNFTKSIQQMRKALGLRAKDKDLAAAEESDGPPKVVVSIPAAAWRVVCQVRGARERVLTAAERWGADGVELEIEICVLAVEEWRLEAEARQTPG